MMRKYIETHYEEMNDEDLLKAIIRERAGSGIAGEILAERSLKELVLDTTLHELIQVDGIGKAKAEQLLAMREIMKRLMTAASRSSSKISSPSDAFQYVRADMMGLRKEQFMILLLDTKNRVIKSVVVSVGTLNASLVHPREVFRPAIKEAANSILLVHNHPSGHTTPSNEDLALTTRLCEVGKLIGIQVVDHVIVTDNDYYSFKEKGHM